MDKMIRYLGLTSKKSSEAREAHESGVNKARLFMSWKLMKLSDG